MQPTDWQEVPSNHLYTSAGQDKFTCSQILAKFICDSKAIGTIIIVTKQSLGVSSGIHVKRIQDFQKAMTIYT